jgi:glycosyltransferase involved in cell wall biosynthesis
MRIIHGPTEIAGQIGILCKELRNNGHQAGGYNWFHTYLNYNSNIINTDLFEIGKEIPTLIHHADLFHFHNGETFFQGFSDLPHMKEAGKKMVMHHWGNDVRTTKLTRELNPYPLPPSYFSDEEIHERLSEISKYIDTAIVQDYEVYPYVKDYYKHVHVLPLAIDIKKFTPSYPRKDQSEPLIIHAPTNREFKGTDYIDNAIEKLRGTKQFNYTLIEKMNHKEALDMYMNSDIIIDQLLIGTYGMLSVEAMAMGKVVVGYIREDVRNQLPYKLPIVTATPENIHDVLADLIDNPEKRFEIGQQGRKYVRDYHASDKVAQQLISIYNNLNQ